MVNTAKGMVNPIEIHRDDVDSFVVSQFFAILVFPNIRGEGIGVFLKCRKSCFFHHIHGRGVLEIGFFRAGGGRIQIGESALGVIRELEAVGGIDENKGKIPVIF